MSSRPLPFRQIHLDFHTGPEIPDVGFQFEARQFAETMKRTHVNSVNVFAKCHHGHLYYTTQRAERHPHLKPGLNLLGEQIEALHREGIAAPIYISVQCDEYAANTHPEWVAVNADSTKVKSGGVFGSGWQILDMSSPYQDYLADQVAEILRNFAPVDGIWFDMCWDQVSCNAYAINGMLKRKLNPESDEDRKLYSRQVAREYMARFRQQVKAACPNALLYFNCRPVQELHVEAEYMEQLEIESLPTGGWGYAHFPRVVRFTRTGGKPYIGMTGRFHKSWADFGGLKPYPAMEYETSQIVAHGGQCSIGDQMHPRGILDQPAYDLIGKAYQRIAQREPWLEGATPLAEIGVIWAPSGRGQHERADDGAVRMLTQLKHQFDLIDPHSDFSRYRLLVLLDGLRLDGELATALQRYLAGGGKVLASGLSCLNDDATKVLLPELCASAHGLSPFTATYFRATELGAGLSAGDHVMYQRGARLKPAGNAKAVAQVVEPYFERSWQHFCSHAQTPADRLSDYAAAILSSSTGYLAYPIFSTFADYGNAPYRELIAGMLNQLLPDPLLRLEGPTTVETTVCRQDKRHIIHVLHYVAVRRGKDIDLIEDILPLHNLPLSLRLERRPERVYLAPSRQPLECKYAAGRASLVLPVVNGHEMVVFE